MSLKLYFLRHGQTAYSKTGGYCGTLENDPGLTPEGLKMAESFAEMYQDIPWQAVFVSPLKRAKQTAEPLCRKLGLKMQIREGLKEIAYGKWEGMHPIDVDREFHDLYVRWLTDPAWTSPPGGERGIDISRRSSEVIAEIEQRYSEGNILLVSHKATIRIMLCSLMGIDIGRYRDRFLMPVAGVSLVELGDRGPLFHAIADRTHLDEYLKSLPST
ncbi:histidine phosphatase family protein [Aphanothece hegewaldii CCALA 016]|uniref:Histidine phosphatase family protein n=1 Tax=Aphanothece hegewaldii CCALA 016 TaxID=2107694 RepID=A0A2T1M2I1_9CHRO|nr:histidine phosphatase family protein [Aphanothece hegewaldii]PSF38965.1 histidine phosphatase family protein [Aphanothece hegewaldii CCALA 016]